MPAVLGVNAVFHDPAAAIVVDGEIVAAAEEERFSRRKHGKNPVPFSTWELPESAIRFCLRQAGLDATELDAVAYSYDPTRVVTTGTDGPDITASQWEPLRTLYAERADRFMHAVLPGLRSGVHHVAHHVAHAASAWGGAAFDSSAVMVLDGRGERSSYLAGVADRKRFEPLVEQHLPHSLGLRYEELTEHLGFRRSSDEYKVMALAAYGKPVHLEELRRSIHVDGNGGFCARPIDWGRLAPPGSGEDVVRPEHADLAASMQARLEEVMLELASWLFVNTGERRLCLAGGVALNCVANSKLFEYGPFDDIWVQPAAGDSGTALGAALQVAAMLGDAPCGMPTAALGPEWSDDEVRGVLCESAVPHHRCDDIARAVAEQLADDAVVAWFQGRSEFGPRALGHRSLMAHPGRAENLDRLNAVKGRERFRPVAPMVTVERAAEIFEGGPIPSPFMLFTHRVRPEWRDRIPAVVHVDGTARIQTVSAADEPLVHRMLSEFERLTGMPVVVNTSLNTAGRPMVDQPRDALECFGSAPVDMLAIGPFAVRRKAFFA
ncbi:MAG: carbamoyltransferase [Acidimicrobiia bacterium]